MKKVIVLAATALLLAGCSATASSAPSASTGPATTASAGASAEAAPAPAASGSNASADPTAPAAAAAAAAAAADSAGYPQLSLADTCTKFTKVFMDNRPAQGSSDNQKYWATVRDGLIPIRAGAAAETKTDMEGVFTWVNTRAEHWDMATAEALAKTVEPSLNQLAITCKSFMPQ